VTATVRWWRQDTPVGEILVEQSGTGAIARVTMPIHEFAEPGGPARPDRVLARRFDDYFRGRGDLVDIPVDLVDAALSDLQRHFLLTLRAEVPYGETVTYGELAELAGRPGAARAAGTAMAKNPVPFLIPCHRVVAANGIGGYGGGPDGVALKRTLLARERRARPTG